MGQVKGMAFFLKMGLITIALFPLEILAHLGCIAHAQIVLGSHAHCRKTVGRSLPPWSYINIYVTPTLLEALHMWFMPPRKTFPWCPKVHMGSINYSNLGINKSPQKLAFHSWPFLGDSHYPFIKFNFALLYLNMSLDLVVLYQRERALAPTMVRSALLTEAWG